MHRHLCEFTGLDLEMAIIDHYNEVIAVLHNTFKVQELEARQATLDLSSGDEAEVVCQP